MLIVTDRVLKSIWFEIWADFQVLKHGYIVKQLLALSGNIGRFPIWPEIFNIYTISNILPLSLLNFCSFAKKSKSKALMVQKLLKIENRPYRILTVKWELHVRVF